MPWLKLQPQGQQGVTCKDNGRWIDVPGNEVRAAVLEGQRVITCDSDETFPFIGIYRQRMVFGHRRIQDFGSEGGAIWSKGTPQHIKCAGEPIYHRYITIISWDTDTRVLVGICFSGVSH